MDYDEVVAASFKPTPAGTVPVPTRRRAAALGEPSPSVVVSSFAVFEPAMISGAYHRGSRACGRQELLSAREQATTAGLDRCGRPLYAGLADRDFPDDPIGLLWRSAGR